MAESARSSANSRRRTPLHRPSPPLAAPRHANKTLTLVGLMKGTGHFLMAWPSTHSQHTQPSHHCPASTSHSDSTLYIFSLAHIYFFCPLSSPCSQHLHYASFYSPHVPPSASPTGYTCNTYSITASRLVYIVLVVARTPASSLGVSQGMKRSR